MKSFKMKALAVAVLGLVGVGQAMAVCPTSPLTSGGGAWAQQGLTAGTLAICPGTNAICAGNSITAGLNGTACALAAAVSATAGQSNAKAFVQDTSPAQTGEPRYRSRFYIDTTHLTITAANRQVLVFGGTAAATPATTGATADEVLIYAIGGTTPFFSIFVGDTATAGAYQNINVNFPSASGKYRVEFDLQQGSPGSFRYWITDAATVTTDASPTGTVAVTNGGWTGIKNIRLGVAATTSQFRVNETNKPLVVDEFDSRRQTFIGL